MSTPIRGNIGKAFINIRIDTALKQKLEAIAANEGLALPDYLRKHYYELVEQKVISPEEDVRIQNPYTPYSPVPNYPTSPYPPPYTPYAQQPDAVDQMVNEMRKLVLVKMLKEMLQEKTTPEQFLAAYSGKGPKEEFSMKDMMQYSMMMAQLDRQQMQAQQQLEIARSKGDAKGENSALNLLAALAQTQAAQQQNFMQQFMLANQNAQNTQQTLFTTALSTNREVESQARLERAEQDAKLEGIRNQMFQGQITSTQEINKVQLDFMNKELDRIRTEGGKKDILSQLNELLMLRTQSPIYKAAFDAAFGVKDEGGIGALIPKLKELGIDKVVDRVAGMLGSIVTRPQIPQPTMPQPILDATGQRPGPLPQPTPEELQKLGESGLEQKQPKETPETTTETVQIENPEGDNVGYTNLTKPGETIQIPTEEETVQIEQPEEQRAYSNLDKPATQESAQPTPEPQPVPQPVQPEPKVWTTGRKQGSKNKPKPEEPTK